MNRRQAIERTAMLLGYAVSAPAAMAVLKGCRATPDLNYTPVFFSMEQAHLVAELAETILPKTTTPGAKDVGVPAFIDRLVFEVYTEEGQKEFIQGLDDLNTQARETMGADFVELLPADRLKFATQVNEQSLSGIDSESEGWWAAGSNAKKPFFLTMKELTLLGFFTSEAGATQVLQYSEVPGPFRGCVPLKEVGKAWAT